MHKSKHIILLFVLVALLLGAAPVHADGDESDGHHDNDVPITEQKREGEGGEGNVAVVFGAIAVFIIGGLAWEFFIKKKE